MARKRTKRRMGRQVETPARPPLHMARRTRKGVQTVDDERRPCVSRRALPLRTSRAVNSQRQIAPLVRCRCLCLRADELG